MSTATLFYYRHRTATAVSSVELFGLGETSNKLFNLQIRKGDTFRFDDLKISDKKAIEAFTKNVPETLTVQEITLESNLEIQDGICKVYLES